MDILDILLAQGVSSAAINAAVERADAATQAASNAAASASSAAQAANTAASAANSAAADANVAISAIYHDKNFILTVNADNSLSLTYDPDAV